MNIAIIKNFEVINVASFKTLEEANYFLELGAFGEVTSVEILPDGFGIGDKYINSEWISAQPPAPEPRPTELERIAKALENMDVSTDEKEFILGLMGVTE